MLVSNHLSFGQNSDQDVVGLKIESGYQIGVGDYGMDRLKLDVTGAHQFYPFLSLGLGTGLRYYYHADAALLPVFVDLKILGSDGKFSPYLSMGVGYSFDATDGFDRVGLLLNPSVAVSFNVSGTSKFHLGLGYEMQKMDIGYYNAFEDNYYGFGYSPYYSYGYSFNSRERKVNVGAICISLGVSF